MTVGTLAHAAGFMEIEPGLECPLDEVDEKDIKICLDTGHRSYSGLGPVAFMVRHMGRIPATTSNKRFQVKGTAR